MKKVFILSLSIYLQLFAVIAIAQAPAYRGNDGSVPKEGKITGSIIDGNSNLPVPYASVALYRVKDSTLLTGVMSNNDGSFTLQDISYGRFYILVTSVGYKKQKLNNILLTPNQKTLAIGTIKVNPTATTLNSVEVIGNTPSITYQIDKKIINIEQNIATSGGTVAEALQNAPSVQTDVQGNITLRGSSNFTVLVDGRPSPIEGSEALQQIPASLVQNVEIITNPSAKYDAEGSAGIINVVMKKQKVQGGSGMFNATAGTGDKYSANVSLNYKISKFNFTLGADFTDMKNAVKNSMNNTDTLSQQLLKTQTVNGSGNFHRQGMGINVGIDYLIDEKNSLTLTGSLGNRTFNRPLNANYFDEYNNLLNPPPTDIYYMNSSSSEVKRSYSTLNLDYHLKLDSLGQQLSASVYFTGGPNNNVSALQVDTTDANWNSLGKTKIDQQSEQNSNETDFRTKADYSLPIGEKGKLEAGYQGRYFNSKAQYSLSNSAVEDISQRDSINFKDQIQAGYVTFSNSIPLFDFQLGLRAEYEDRVLKQEILNKEYKINRIDFFPTVHLTRQLPWSLQLQASYTRRINRPREWNIDPFIVHLDPQTIRQGNAGLLPEFANSYELNLEKKLTETSFISIEGFLRQTSNLIQQISTFDPGTQITTNTFANIDHDRSIGGELMLYIEPVKWFNLNSSFNIFNYHMFGTPIPSVANKTNTWNIRVNPTFKISKQTTIQINYTYNAPTITAQGTHSGYYSSTIGIKQSLFKQKGSLTLQMRNLLGKTNSSTTTESAYQYRYSNFQRESQVFLLTFSYRFNNYKVKQNNKQNQDNNTEEQDMEGPGL